MGPYLGLISGTSMDAIDAALVDFDVSPLSLIAASAVPFEPALKERAGSRRNLPVGSWPAAAAPSPIELKSWTPQTRPA
jgi:1,6-anhydro-N-acetylmuramate kinase